HHAAALRARIGGQRDLVLKVRFRTLVRLSEAGAIQSVLPAVVHAAKAALLVAREVERRAPMRAELADQTRPSARIAKRDEVLAEDPDALGAAAGSQLGGF